MASYPFYLLCTVLCLLAYPVYLTICNYQTARRLGLPVIITPLTWQSNLWQPLAPLFSFIQHIPILGSWYRYSLFSWTFDDAGRTNERLGPAVAIVSPFPLEIILADPAASQDVFMKWKEYIKPGDIYKIFEVFGPNSNTVNGQDWMRHRKIGSIGFREANCKIVWKEGIRQAESMVALFKQGDKTRSADVDLKTMQDNINLLAMHVLMAAGFGREYDFGPEGLKKDEPGFSMSYGYSLEVLLRNILFTILFSTLKAPEWLLPTTLRKLKTARGAFMKHMEAKVQEEKDAFAQEKNGSGESYLGDTLVASLVRANEKAKEESDASLRFVLNDEELFGNIFIYNLAGFETTSTQLTYSLPLLAANRDIQDWIREEIDDVMSRTSSYEEAYPQLVRTLAVMYETLRLYGAVQQLPRTCPSPTSLRLKSTTLDLPPHTLVSINLPALHRSPAVWGPDANEWKPKRWIRVLASEAQFNGHDHDEGRAKKTKQRGSATHATTRPDGTVEVLDGAGPDGESFVAWLNGPRMCPGRKFSQVEFVSVLVAVVRGWRVEVGEGMGGGDGEARRRLQGVVQDSTFNLTPKIREPRSGRVRFVRREG